MRVGRADEQGHTRSYRVVLRGSVGVVLLPPSTQWIAQSRRPPARSYFEISRPSRCPRAGPLLPHTDDVPSTYTFNNARTTDPMRSGPAYAQNSSSSSACAARQELAARQRGGRQRLRHAERRGILRVRLPPRAAALHRPVFHREHLAA